MTPEATSYEDIRKRLVDWYEAAGRIQNQYFGERFTPAIIEMLRRVLQDALADVGLAEHFVVRARAQDQERQVQVMPQATSPLAQGYVAFIKARDFKTLAPPSLGLEFKQ